MKKKSHGMRSELMIHGKKHKKAEPGKFEKKEQKI